jgi:exosome complex RNA-binding protein Csl4
MQHDIVMPDARYASGWNFLYGHGCYTKEEMEKYAARFQQAGMDIRVIELPFDPEDANNPIGKPQNMQMQEVVAPSGPKFTRESLDEIIDLWRGKN